MPHSRSAFDSLPACFWLLVALVCFAARPALSEETLYQSLGATPGIAKIVDVLLQKTTKDPRIADKFDNINIAYLQQRLVARLCEWTGGPCQTHGASMRGAHAELGLTDRHFNALVEDLEAAMDEAGTPYNVQNRLLALLAPKYYEIVNH